MSETLPRVARLIGPDSIIWPPKARRGQRCLNRWRPTGNSGRQGRCGCGDTIRIGEAKKGQETVRGPFPRRWAERLDFISARLR
jgi:hypothetical protein